MFGIIIRLFIMLPPVSGIEIRVERSNLQHRNVVFKTHFVLENDETQMIAKLSRIKIRMFQNAVEGMGVAETKNDNLTFIGFIGELIFVMMLRLKLSRE